MRNIRYSYYVKGKKKIEHYSGVFKTKNLAELWYNKHGISLEKMFNIKLILRRTDEPKNI